MASPSSELNGDIAPTRNRRPAGVDDATVAAVGKLSEAIEWLERARGELFAFHQMIGHLDFQLSDAAQMLRQAGHPSCADMLEREAIGRNVLDGRWTFQVVEEFEDTYYAPLSAVERTIREQLMSGRRHVYEAELKEQRRSIGQSAHESRPPSAHDPRVATESHVESTNAKSQNGGMR
jgi:hypothetical protein